MVMTVVIANVAVTVGVGELTARLSWCQVLLSYRQRRPWELANKVH